MRVVYIYVEGKSDLLFMCHFLNTFFKFQFQFDSKSWKGLHKTENELEIVLQTLTPKDGFGGIDNKKITDLINEIKTYNNPKGIDSILIIDSDTTTHNNPKGGFKSREEYLNNFKKEANFDFFLIPTHEEDGNLESILDVIVCEKGRDFYGHLTKYIDKLLTLEGEKRPQYIIDNPKLEKEKIGWYIYMMEGKASKNNKNEINPNLWDLSTEKLNPLRKFFKNIFK